MVIRIPSQDFWRHLVHGALHSWIHGEVQAVEKKEAPENKTNAKEEVNITFLKLNTLFSRSGYSYLCDCVVKLMTIVGLTLDNALINVSFVYYKKQSLIVLYTYRT